MWSKVKETDKLVRINFCFFIDSADGWNFFVPIKIYVSNFLKL